MNNKIKKIKNYVTKYCPYFIIIAVMARLNIVLKGIFNFLKVAIPLGWILSIFCIKTQISVYIYIYIYISSPSRPSQDLLKIFS